MNEIDELEEARKIASKYGLVLRYDKEDKLEMLEKEAKLENMKLSKYIAELEEEADKEGMSLSKYIGYLEYLASDAKAIREEEEAIYNEYSKPYYDEYLADMKYRL